ncbi:hypothetical protein Bbelb_327400 [Branchiostoma belcheri]|nr:hypothetical protein Bbelb_327400 [Branchiostoma belcheri]
MHLVALAIQDHACGGQTLQLSCSVGQTLLIDDANYGRTSAVHTCGSDSSTGCQAPNSLSTMRERCQGLQLCCVTADDQVFGDPCSGVPKYLEVTYRCQDTATEIRCGPEWYSHGSKCYRVFDTQVPYEGAKGICACHYSHLALPKDQTTNNFLVELRNCLNRNLHTWIGLNDAEEDGNFVWEDEEPLGSFNDWGPQKPDQGGAGCVGIASSSSQNVANKWDDVDCSLTSGFICETDTFQRDCDNPPALENTFLPRCSCFSLQWNSQCTYECLPGFHGVSGDVVRTCDAQGNWMGSDLVCKGKRYSRGQLGAPGPTVVLVVDWVGRREIVSVPTNQTASATGIPEMFSCATQFNSAQGLLNPTDDPNGTHTWLEARRLQKAGPEAILPRYNVTYLLRYNRSTLLPEMEGGGFDIAVSAYLRHVGQLSDKHANMSVTIEYIFSWINSTLSGLTDGWVPAPDSLVSPPPLAFGTTVRQAAAVDGEASSRWLNEEGLVVYKMTRKFKVSCSVSLKNYPFDTQTCVVQLRGYGGARLRLLPLDDVTLAAIKTDATEVVSQFELTGVEIQGAFHSFMSNTKGCIFFKKTCDYDIDRCLFGHYESCDTSEECRQCRRTVGTCRSELDDCRHYHSDSNGYTTIDVLVHLRRRLMSSVLRVFLPSVTVVVSAYLQLWMPLRLSDITGRFSLAVTTYLAMIYQSSSVRMPWISEARAVDIWFGGCQALITLMMLETGLVHFIYSSRLKKEEKKVRKQQENPPIRIPRPGYSTAPASSLEELFGRRCPEGVLRVSAFDRISRPFKIPRPKLKDPGNIMWHRLPDQKWIVIPRPEDKDEADSPEPAAPKDKGHKKANKLKKFNKKAKKEDRRSKTQRPESIPLQKLDREFSEMNLRRRRQPVRNPGEDLVHVGWELAAGGGWKSVYGTEEMADDIAKSCKPIPRANTVYRLRGVCDPDSPVVTVPIPAEFTSYAFPPSIIDPEEEAEKLEKIEAVPARIDRVARIVFPVVFVAFCIGFSLHFYYTY